jgi:exopolysaccharide biosynthesis WecB/TagA/CpsF family protein
MYSAVENGEGSTGPRSVARVDGWTINVATQSDAVHDVISAARAGKGFSCFTLNLDHLVKLRRSRALRDAYRNATFVTADGAPIAKMARRQWPAVTRTTGADLFVPMCKAAADNAVPIYLFGTSDAVLAATEDYLGRQTAGRLRVVGREAPPLGFDVADPLSDDCIRRIGQSGAKLCFVMLGAPKQEIFAARALAQGVRAGFVCVGAAADFIGGREVRAPLALQSAGLEWLWRLLHNPGRLGTRYAQCAILLAKLKFAYWAGAKASQSTS